MPPPTPKLTVGDIDDLMPGELSINRASALSCAMRDCVDERDIQDRAWRTNDRDLHWDYGRVMSAWQMKEEG